MNRRWFSTYGCAIAALSAVILATSLRLDTVPQTTIVALVTAIAVQALVGELRVHRRAHHFDSAVITALVIGAVAPSSMAVFPVVLAVTVAILSKWLLRWSGNPVFNPAAIGLLVLLVGFRVSPTTWASGSYDALVLVAVVPVLALMLYSTRRLVLGLFFSGAYAALCLASFGVAASFSLGWMGTLIGTGAFGVGLVMATDPRTSPPGLVPQAAFGAGLVLLTFLVEVSGVGVPLLAALLVGNLAWAAYRHRAQWLSRGWGGGPTAARPSPFPQSPSNPSAWDSPSSDATSG